MLEDGARRTPLDVAGWPFHPGERELHPRNLFKHCPALPARLVLVAHRQASARVAGSAQEPTQPKKSGPSFRIRSSVSSDELPSASSNSPRYR